MNKIKTENQIKKLNNKVDQVLNIEKKVLKQKTGNKRSKHVGISKNAIKLLSKNRYTENFGDPNLMQSTSVNPNFFRGKPLNTTLRLLRDYESYLKTQYLMGALHPQLAFENRWDVRMPNMLPIPTACVRVMHTHNLTTGSLGQLYVNYTPGTLVPANSAQFEASGITANTTCDGSGVPGSNSFRNQPFYNIPQLWDRWRLVAAEIKLTYTGPVLQQQGTIYGGVHYEPIVVATKGVSGSGAISGVTNPNVDRFSSNLGLIKNQLWPTVKTVTAGETFVSYVWTPDSAANFLFPGYLPQIGSQGVVITGTQSWLISNGSNATANIQSGSINTNGPDRNYNFYCQGLPVSSQCIRADIYEIFEYIPDVSGYNIVNTSPVRLEANDVKALSSAIPVNNVDSNTAKLITQSLSGKSTGSFIDKIEDGVNRYKPLFSVAGNMLKALMY
jgi:hypothetical protein